MAALFDALVNDFDNWFDTPEGSAIFEEEVQCLRNLCDDYHGRWLEIGVGTGRFALALGIPHGIDLSFPMVRKACCRGIRAQVGRAEQLPYRRGSFDGVLMVVTLCFLENPEWSLLECARILRSGGRLIIGTIPADSSWGKAYIKKGTEGHPVYSHARIHTLTQTICLAEQANFKLRRSCSALLWEQGCTPPRAPRTEAGRIAGAGFVGLLFEARQESGTDDRATPAKRAPGGG